MLHTHEDNYPFPVLTAGFSQEVYAGDEGPDRQSSLPNMPCTVTITLQSTIETPLTFRLIPRTIFEILMPMVHPQQQHSQEPMLQVRTCDYTYTV